MAKKKGASLRLNLLGLFGGFIAGPILVLAMMSSASKSGRPVGYEGFFYFLVSPFAGATAGVVLCNALEKGNDFEDLD